MLGFFGRSGEGALSMVALLWGPFQLWHPTTFQTGTLTANSESQGHQAESGMAFTAVTADCTQLQDPPPSIPLEECKQCDTSFSEGATCL